MDTQMVERYRKRTDESTFRLQQHEFGNCPTKSKQNVRYKKKRS
jgi:hypothetical protein